MINFNEYKSILCLNGELPPADFFKTSLPIIAADGATNTLMKMGITPQLIIGDLDGVEKKYLDMIPSHYHYDQNYCDFEKSLFYLKEHALLPTIIVGTSGGYLDHILNNINIFLGVEGVLYAPPIWGYTLKAPMTRIFTLPVDTKLSLLGIPSATFSTTGLKWNLQEQQITFPGRNSCFNRTVQKEIEINLHEGTLLVLIYERF